LGITLPGGYANYIATASNCIALATANKCAFTTNGSQVIVVEFYKDHTTATPVSTNLFQPTSEQPTLVPFLTENQLVVQHNPVPTVKPDFSIFTLPKVSQVQQGGTPTPIWPTYRWTPDKSTRVMSVSQNSDKNSLIWIETKNYEQKNTKYLTRFDTGVWRLEGEGYLTEKMLSDTGFKIGNKKLPLREFITAKPNPEDQSDDMIIEI
jgi:hypothetical protein